MPQNGLTARDAFDSSTGQSEADSIRRRRSVEVSFRQHLFFATLAGIALRLLLACFVRYDHPGGDAVGYDRLARNLAQHGVYSASATAPYVLTAARPPLLPFVASISYRLFSTSRLPMHVLQAALGLVVAIVVTLAVRRATPPAANVTAWFTMLSPFDAIYAGVLLTEPLNAFFACVGMCIPVLWETPWAWAFAGAFLGAAALTRETSLPLVPVVCCLALLLGVLRGKAARLAPFLLCSGAALVIVPWTVRNCHAVATCAPVSKGLMGPNLWVGTWARDGSWETPSGPVWPDAAFESAAEREQLSGLDPNDPANDLEFRRVALAHIRGKPMRVLLNWMVRERHMWVGTRTDLFEFRRPFARQSPLWYALKMFCFGLNATWLLLAAMGLAWSAKHSRRLLWLAIPIATTLVVYFPFNNSETRYSQPVYPLLLAFAALGVVCVRRHRLLATRATEQVETGGRVGPQSQVAP